MADSNNESLPLSQVHASLNDLAEQVKAGTEKILTKNGEDYVAIIDADKLAHYHRLERENLHLLLIDEAAKGLDDVLSGRVKDARSTIQNLKRRRQAVV